MIDTTGEAEVRMCKSVCAQPLQKKTVESFHSIYTNTALTRWHSDTHKSLPIDNNTTSHRTTHVGILADCS
jgi:hypothetical protein